jgi:hypothetical protein
VGEEGEWLHHVSELELIDLFHVWMGTSSGHDSMSRPLLLTMEKWVQHYIKQLKGYDASQATSMSELLIFIEAELLMSFYKCLPKQYFDKSLKNRYEEAQSGIAVDQYRLVLQALSTSEHMKDNVSDLEWSAPNGSDTAMARVIESFRKILFRKGQL